MATKRTPRQPRNLATERSRLLAELESAKRELAIARQEAKATAELKEAFIRVAGHELRTPVTLLVGLTHLIGQLPALPGPAKAWIARLERTADRLRNVVEELLTMLDAGQLELPLVRRSVDVRELVAQAVEEVKPFLDARQQKIDVHAIVPVGRFEVEPMRIRDTLGHLLLNAIKFSPNGGTIRVGLDRTDEGCVEIRVSDAGRGIDRDDLSRIFDPFFTGFDVSHHASGSFEYGRKGLGLGLSVAKALVERHGGRLEVVSEIGRGTTFTMRLPAGQRTASDHHAA
jgi:signal transduction histidine kinase